MTSPLYQLKKTMLNGEIRYKLKCPNCEQYFYLSDKQFHGLEFAECVKPTCDFQVKLDFSKLIKLKEHNK